jgi:hypothetical protein
MLWVVGVTVVGTIGVVLILLQSHRPLLEPDWEIIGGSLLLLLAPALLLVPLLAIRKKAKQRPTVFGLGLMGGVWLLNAAVNCMQALTHQDGWRWFSAGAFLLAAFGCYMSLYKISKRIPKELID